MRKNKKEKNVEKQVKYLFVILILLISISFALEYLLDKKISKEKELQRQQTIYTQIKEKFNIYVKTNKNIDIYKLEKDKYTKAGTISKDTELSLEKKEIKNYKDTYFKLANIDYYVNYKDFDKIDNITNDERYKNYIPFNLNVVTENKTILYSDLGNIYTINEGINLPIIIKDTDKYYVEYDNKLLYVKSNEVKETIYNLNSSSEVTSKIAVVLYHYVYGDYNKSECTNTIICHSVAQVRSHFEYLKENNYYTVSMKELDLWIDKKIQLPKNSVTITIDDGWFVDEMKLLLEEYKFHGTLFLITSLVPANAYKSDYLEIHSHTHNMHYVGKCSGGQGSPIKCLPENEILTDLKTSREKLNNTTYFSWPFYEYNDYSMKLLKQAGFTMAFKGGTNKATQGIDKFLVPRITMHNTTTVNQFASYIK